MVGGIHIQTHRLMGRIYEVTDNMDIPQAYCTKVGLRCTYLISKSFGIYLITPNFIFSVTHRPSLMLCDSFLKFTQANILKTATASESIGYKCPSTFVYHTHKAKFLIVSNSFAFHTSLWQVQFSALNIRIGMGSWCGTTRPCSPKLFTQE
jgi:hypothetical protein